MKRIFALIAALFLTNCAFADLKYIEIESVKNAPTVQVKSIEDFETIIAKNKVSTAYLHKPSDTLLVAEKQGFPVPEEFLAENGTLKNSNPLYLMKIGSAGADFYNSQENGFPNYAEYTAAREKEISTYADLQKYREITNFCDKLSKSKKIDKGFALIYHQIQHLQKSEMSLSVLSKTLTENYSIINPDVKNALNSYLKAGNPQQGNHKKYAGNNSQARINSIPDLFYESALKEFFGAIDITQLGTYSSQSEIFKKK